MEGEEKILLKITRAVALLLVELDEKKWRKYLVKENGKWTICVLCDKYTYGTMNTALLSYKKLVKSFKGWGMTMNLCNLCVKNKMDDNKQITIIFYIDNLMLVHKNPIITTKYIKLLNEIYRSKDPLTVTRGKVHEYLDMTIDFLLKIGYSITQYDFAMKMRR